MQNRTDNIRRNTRLIILHHREIKRHDPRIFNQNVKPLQPLRALCKFLDRLIRREIKLPHLDDARPSGGLFDGFFRGLAFFEIADREDDFGGVKTHKVARGFETEAGVAACDDDGLAGVFFGGVGGVEEELGAEEGNGLLNVGHLGGLVGMSFSEFDFDFDLLIYVKGEMRLGFQDLAFEASRAIEIFDLLILAQVGQRDILYVHDYLSFEIKGLVISKNDYKL